MQCDITVVPVTSQRMSHSGGAVIRASSRQHHHTVAWAVGECSSHLLLAMARLIFVALAVLGIAQKPWLVDDHTDVDMHERMQQHAEQLSQGMARLLQEMEQKRQEQSGVALGALLFTALQQWQLWTLADLLVLLFGLCRWLRKRSRELGSRSKQGSSTRKKEDDGDADQDGDSDDIWELGKVWDDRTQWPAPYMADKCKMVEELVDELLGACRGLSMICPFKPQLQPAIGVGCLYEGWSAREDNVLYRLLVPLRPPPGHTFHPELGTVGKTAKRNPALRVELECACVREQLVGDMLCFLHHPEDELSRRQEPSLLRTLCTGSYLNVEETTRWFQALVKAAWELLPQSRRCRLTVLPSRRSCKIKLVNASKSTLSIEITLGVQIDGSGTFLSLA
ncbi:inositol 1,4,5-trisphosphate receptor-interacting protein-like 1 [Anser cygnoides]|uniref:inositol 1,4,5-trisphosphate receptor-interacting protein-like 1 n=1 Tax=Anser cygnoides TaxID=8845 RepID=UPI0034D25B81